MLGEESTIPDPSSRTSYESTTIKHSINIICGISSIEVGIRSSADVVFHRVPAKASAPKRVEHSSETRRMESWLSGQDRHGNLAERWGGLGGCPEGYDEGGLRLLSR